MQYMSKYLRLTDGLEDKGILIKPEELYQRITDPTRDWYASPYYYNEEQYKSFQKTKSVRGIDQVLTNAIWFDFDDKKNPELARTDAIELVNRLKNNRIPEKDIEIAWSGMKGVSIKVTLNRWITPEQVQALTINKYAKDLKTLDLSVYNPNRVLRVLGTKHNVTGLYKYPLTFDQLKNKSVDEIKVISKSLDDVPDNLSWNVVSPPEEFFDVPVVSVKEEKKQLDLVIDWTKKPRHWKDFRWAISQGYYEPGERNNALMVLAASCNALGYDQEQTKALCMASITKQAERYNQEPFKEHDLDKTILATVFSPLWEGAQYSPKSNPWLMKYCEKLGLNVNEKESSTVEISEAFDLFKNYAQNIDDLTIQTGIKPIDEKLRMTVGMSVGILAPPAVGKTSIAIQILNNVSKQGHQCIFFSYDMFHALVTQKLIQKHFSMDGEEIYKRYKDGDLEFQKQVTEVLTREYSNVRFCFDSGQSIEQIEDTITKVQEETGRKVKMIVIDYNELVVTGQSDSTASSGFVAQNIRRIANVHQLCAINLIQPSKVTGSPSDEIKSYRSIKGSSQIEQALGIILGVSRPGFDPRHPEDDNYITINCLKNRMGKIFSLDLHWDGMTGNVRQMRMEEEVHLQEVRDRKLREEEASNKQWDN